MAAKFRRLFLLEKLQLYGEALQELDSLEQVAREGLQCWSSGSNKDEHKSETAFQTEKETEKTKFLDRTSTSHDGQDVSTFDVDDAMVPLFVINASGRLFIHCMSFTVYRSNRLSSFLAPYTILSSYLLTVLGVSMQLIDPLTRLSVHFINSVIC